MWRRLLLTGGLIALALAVLGTVRGQMPAEASEVQVVYQVGAGKADVTPTDWETRIYWMAGYGAFRAATSVNDPLMTRVLIIDDGSTPLAIVTFDLLGITSDDADAIQGVIAAQLPQLADHILIHATHQHEGPDTIGIWGGAGSPPFGNPRPQDYMDYLAAQATAAAQQAWDSRAPVSVTFANIQHDPLLDDLVQDSRTPQVWDPYARLIVFHDGGGAPVATLVNWASHPEVLGSENQAMTADFVKWVVDEIEENYGGAGIFVNGAIGGLLSSNGGDVLPDLPDDSFEKAEAVGRQLTQRLMAQLANPGPNDIVATYQTLPPLQFSTREFYLPVENKALILGQALNRIPKQMVRQFEIPPQEWRRTNPLAKYTNTETNFVRMGPAAILTVGGELYPELLVGGIEPIGVPPFDAFPPEPPLVNNPGFAPYDFQFFFGLTNDFIGYIIPVSEWDGWAGGQYGEDFALSHDEGFILSYNLHLLMLGYETGEYPAEMPAFMPPSPPLLSEEELLSP